MRKYLILAPLILFFHFNSLAQSNIAKITYDDAEEAFSKGDYPTVFTKLNEAEKALGKLNPPIAYLWVATMDKMLDNLSITDTTLLRKTINISAFYLKQYGDNTSLIDKYREVYRMNDRLKVKGDSFAMFEGADYKKGDEAYGQGKLPEALILFKKAADAGSARAASMVGRLYYFKNVGVTQDSTEGVKWYRKAADGGYDVGMYRTAMAYQKGEAGIPKDINQAIAWHKKAAAKGNLSSMLRLGEIYSAGDGVSENFAEAMTFFKKAAAAGDNIAAYKVGILYYNGQGVTQNFYEAFNWIKQAADKGYLQAIRDLGLMYDNGQGTAQNYTEAMTYYHKASDKGDLNALNDIGTLYYNGSGVPQNYTEAMVWFRKAADRGLITAINNIMVAYKADKVPNPDYPWALSLFKKAASDLPDAAYMVGLFYANGRGTTVDFSQAVVWYGKAADKDQLDAVKALATCYEYGTGVVKDAVKAQQLIAKSAEISSRAK